MGLFFISSNKVITCMRIFLLMEQVEQCVLFKGFASSAVTPILQISVAFFTELCTHPCGTIPRKCVGDRLPTLHLRNGARNV